MIRFFRLDHSGLHGEVLRDGVAVPDEAIWIDLVEPSADEESRIEQFLRIDVPTREEMRESRPRIASIKKATRSI